MSVVLFVDDDAAATEALIRALSRHGAAFECCAAQNSEEALKEVRTRAPEVAVVDLTLDDSVGPESGLAVVSGLLHHDPSMRVLVLTGHGAEEYGLNALHHGAASFLEKPVDSAHLLALIDDGITYARLRRQYNHIQKTPDNLLRRTGLSSRSPAMQTVLEEVSYAASTAQPLFISGETGTGKGVLAQAIHRASARHNKPFVRFQPGYRGQDLISSELFGHLRGAFTGASDNRSGILEEVNGGTLFIDEVDELPAETQVLLLNVLQERVFRKLGSNKDLHSDFRLIAATNRATEEIIRSKKLREDFYHRIAHFVIAIPPLRERREDISNLASDFLRELANRENLSVHGFSQDALAQLHSYPWPGNVRELQAVVEGGVYRACFREKRLVEASDLQFARTIAVGKIKLQSLREEVKRFELELVKVALSNNNDNQTQAAKALALDRTSFRRILAREKQ